MPQSSLTIIAKKRALPTGAALIVGLLAIAALAEPMLLYFFGIPVVLLTSIWCTCVKVVANWREHSWSAFGWWMIELILLAMIMIILFVHRVPDTGLTSLIMWGVLASLIVTAAPDYSEWPSLRVAGTVIQAVVSALLLAAAVQAFAAINAFSTDELTNSNFMRLLYELPLIAFSWTMFRRLIKSRF